MSTYVFDQAWHLERNRLRALEDMYDAGTTRHLAGTGVGEGWRCLEVGCGAGGIALWLADRVGSTGRVVATDLDPRFLAGTEHGRDNLEVWQHDICADPLDDASFDLVHARALLEHLPAREAALARMVQAVRPGGWVVVEDVVFGGVLAKALGRFIDPPEFAPLFEKVADGIAKVFTAVGADSGFGTRLPATLATAGLVNVAGECHMPIITGGRERDFVRFTVQHLRSRLVEMAGFTEDDVELVLKLTGQQSVRYVPPFMVTAWGQRPRA
jgi:SAM-dependent methyltransferase